MKIKKTLHSRVKYLEPELISQCFYKNKVTHVDKRLCGNGFSSTTLKLIPPEGKVNILIAPNRQVVIDKEKEYRNRRLDTTNRIKFFYGGCKDENFENADVLVFVADSFLGRKDSLKFRSGSIDKVLIDEWHTTESQSTIRYKLINFEKKVKNICNDKNTSIVTVTASPNLLSKIDLTIDNSFIKETLINYSNDREKGFNRVKESVKRNEVTVIFTNATTIPYRLKNRKREIRANFKVGIAFMQTLSEKATIIQDDESKLIIVSSSAYEGIDLLHENANVFYFEDRSNDSETFNIANFYQAFNRLRNGAKYIEYNRQDLSSDRKLIFSKLRTKKNPKSKDSYQNIQIDGENIDGEINDFIKKTNISVEEKQKRIYKSIHDFVIFESNDNGGFTISRNDTLINLYKEKLLFDKPFPAKEFDSFLTSRKITIKNLGEGKERLKKCEKIRETSKVKNLLSNTKLIDDLDLFGADYLLKVIELKSFEKGKPIHDNREAYLKHFKGYLRRKNYSGSRILTERENKALNLLSDEKEFQKVVREIVKTYNDRSIKKYGKVKSLEYRESFKNKSFNTVCKLILAFAKYRIEVPSKWVANRNYNLSTEIGVREIEVLCDTFNVNFLELDIKNCYPRLVYAKCGLELPDDFYGENKKNKLSINIFLNNFFYRAKLCRPKRDQYSYAVKRFTELGFNGIVIKYLMDNYFECEYRGDLFNDLAYYEKEMITSVKKVLKYNSGAIRRHDSVLVFDNMDDLTFLNEIEFEGLKGWFDYQEIPVIQLNSYDEDFELWELKHG